MLINCLWAVASLGLDVPEAMLVEFNGKWAQVILESLPQDKEQDPLIWAQHVANILWAYSQLRLDPLDGRYVFRLIDLLPYFCSAIVSFFGIDYAFGLRMVNHT